MVPSVCQGGREVTGKILPHSHLGPHVIFLHDASFLKYPPLVTEVDRGSMCYIVVPIMNNDTFDYTLLPFMISYHS